MIYWIVFCAIIFYSFYELYSKDKVTKKALLYNIYIVIILLRGLRWETGTDWVSYLTHFNNPESIDFEIGYELLVKCVRLFTIKYTWFLLIFNGLILFIIDRSLSIITTKRGFFLLLYFTGTALFPVRQHLASAFIFLLFAIVAGNNYSVGKLFLTLLSAFSIHITAFSGSVLLFLRNRSKISVFVFFSASFAFISFSISNVLGKNNYPLCFLFRNGFERKRIPSIIFC